MVGEIASNFSLEDQNGEIFELYKNLDKKNLLVFYPKDKSLVCTKQLSDYNQNLEVFDKHNIRIVAINTESANSHLSFCNEQNFNFPLLSDKTKVISRNYDSLNRFGINKRKLVLVDTDKKIRFERVSHLFRFLDWKQIIDLIKHK